MTHAVPSVLSTLQPKHATLYHNTMQTPRSCRGSQSMLTRFTTKGRMSANELETRSASLAAPTLEDLADCSPSQHTTESLLSRARRDNCKLVEELEQLEAQIKEAEQLQAEQENLQDELNELRLTLVSAAQVKSVQDAIRREKACVAVLEVETDALKTELLRHEQKKKKKMFGRA